MKVIHLSVECFPVAKVGGLADVVGALPKYQQMLGVDVSVVMPWYDKPFMKNHALQAISTGSFYQGTELLNYIIWKEEGNTLGFPLYMIQIPGKLDRPEIYCYPDEAEQWIAFQHAFLHWLAKDAILPDVINCHDHHTGLIPFLLQYSNDYKHLSTIKTVFTVHNGQYQGWMNWNKAALLPAYDAWKWGFLDWGGAINPMAAALKCADRYTTVSEGYLEELYVEANGLQDLFLHEAAKGIGIVNGIDIEYWNSETDKLIPIHYSIKNLTEGKLANKKLFCEKVGLPYDIPLLSYIGRFAIEKGADLLAEIIQSLYKSSNNELAVFILGSGDQVIQKQIEDIANQFPKHVRVFFGYNESLAHEVYAASDLLIMPSRVEPCGLNQLYALKYGTIPIVRNIGGLKDTVLDVKNKNGYGYVFASLQIQEIVQTIERALVTYKNTKHWKSVRQRTMKLDYSWGKSAQKYVELYNQLVKKL